MRKIVIIKDRMVLEDEIEEVSEGVVKKIVRSLSS